MLRISLTLAYYIARLWRYPTPSDKYMRPLRGRFWGNAYTPGSRSMLRISLTRVYHIARLWRYPPGYANPFTESLHYRAYGATRLDESTPAACVAGRYRRPG